MTYTITTENGDILAENMTETMVVKWWTQNEEKWFGLRVVEQTIVVTKAQ